MNFFQPSMKLVTKRREGSKVQRHYDAAQTPFQRLVGSGILAEEKQQHLTQVFHALDPVRLLQQIQALQDALWHHVVPESSLSAAHANLPPTSPHVRFDITACLPAGEVMVDDKGRRLATSTVATTSQVQKRKYHRTEKSLGPRTYRTGSPLGPDPFDAVAAEVHQWFLAAPAPRGLPTAKSLLQELQARYPDRYPDHLLRTLQRRVHTWRSQVILEFDDRLLREDAILTHPLPAALRAIEVIGTMTLSDIGR